MKSISKDIKVARKTLNALRADSERRVIDLDLPEFEKNMEPKEFWRIIEAHLKLRGFKVINT